MLRYFKENREILVTKTIKYHQNSSLSYRLNYELLFSPTSPCKSCVKLVWPSILSLVFMCRMIISILHASVYIECTDECVFLSIILYYTGLLEGVADKKNQFNGYTFKGLYIIVHRCRTAICFIFIATPLLYSPCDFSSLDGIFLILLLFCSKFG